MVTVESGVDVAAELFTYRDLQLWLADPFGTPPVLPDFEQLYFTLAWFGQAVLAKQLRPRHQNPAS